MALDIRSVTDDDVPCVIKLWESAGLTRPWNDPQEDIRRARAVWPELFLVAVDGTAVVGTVMAGYDGHRGWLYYLATDSDRRGEGIGRSLVTAAESRLRALGCPKVMLMVRGQYGGTRLLRSPRLPARGHREHGQAADSRYLRDRLSRVPWCTPFVSSHSGDRSQWPLRSSSADGSLGKDRG